MSTEYKGHTLSTTGDKNWGTNELNLNKEFIDTDISLDTREDILEDFETVYKNTVQNGYTRKFKVNAGETVNLLKSTPINTEYRVTVRPYINKHLMKFYFCDGDVLDDKWIFAPTVKTQYIFVKGERVLDIILPSGFAGTIATYPIGELPYNPNYPYRIAGRIGSPMRYVDQVTNVNFAIYTLTQNYGRQYYSDECGMWMLTFGSPFSVYEEERGGENFEYRIYTVDSTPSTEEIHLYLGFVDLSENADGENYDGSLYMGKAEVLNGVFTFTEKIKKGSYSTNPPVLDNGNITPVADSEVEVTITYESLY